LEIQDVCISQKLDLSEATLNIPNVRIRNVHSKGKMQSKTYFGTYPIKGRWVDLYLQIEVDYNQIAAKNPIPDNYPQTEISETLEMLFSSMMFYEDDQPSLYLSTFYVLPKKLGLQILSEEQQMLDGMGKKALCMMVEWSKRHFQMSNEDQIRLTANSSIGREVSRQDINKVSLLYNKQDLIHAMSRYRSIVDLEDYDLDELIMLYLHTKNTRSLIRYYQREYGFMVVEDYGDEASMSTTLGTLLQRC